MGGSGGHTTEMLTLVESLDQDKYHRTFLHANTDSMSAKKLTMLPSQDFQVSQIPRAREVGQGWIWALLFTVIAIFKCFPIVFRCKPDVVLINGPGTCVPVVIVARILSFLKLCPKPKIIFVESICRVKTLSMSAKLLWYWVDDIIVQWPELIKTTSGLHRKTIGKHLKI